MLIDAHCHLDDAQFAADLDAVVARATDLGVDAVVTAGTDVASSGAAAALAARHAIVYAVVGIHPHAARSFDDEALAAIRALAREPKVVGIGEIGLDWHYANGAPRELQERVFVAQLELAAELGMPVVVHDREAHDRVLTLIRGDGPRGRGVLHCFSGDLDMARAAIDLDYCISFAGNLTFKNARALHEVARATPLEHVVVETDAPYLSPRRGQRNEPANVACVTRRLAELKRVDESLVAQAAAQNSRALFGLS
ncbi:MAG: TatD family hydrolase [Chloroflexi bacterium]|nr:TatD family hydrolase [Chloroflexota bacterium]